MVMEDGQTNINITTFNEECDKFRNLINEGQTIMIKKFSCRIANERYNNAASKYDIRSSDKANRTRLNDDSREKRSPRQLHELQRPPVRAGGPHRERMWEFDRYQNPHKRQTKKRRLTNHQERCGPHRRHENTARSDSMRPRHGKGCAIR